MISFSSCSTITIINDECMESELKSLPVWLLAVIKAISAKTRKINESIRSAKTENTLASLASFCKFYKSDEFLQTNALLQEFSWLTRTPVPAASEALKALIRRKLIVFHGDKTCLSIPNPYLLGIFSDYQKAKDLDKPWPPFCLTLQQKRILVLLSTLENGTSKDSTGWLSFFKERNFEITVADWLQIQQFEWFIERNHQLSLDLKRINYFETALKYEQNIKGTV